MMSKACKVKMEAKTLARASRKSSGLLAFFYILSTTSSELCNSREAHDVRSPLLYS